MKTYRIQFQLKSSLRTPFHADTIFGHLCWALRYLKGEDRLKEWLESFKSSPTLISNAFKDGLIPRPVLPAVQLSLQGRSVLLSAALFKKMKKISFLKEEWVYQNQMSFSSKVLMEELLRIAEEEMQNKSRGKSFLKTDASVAITHNTYDRLSGRVLEGSLYDWIETFYLQHNGEPQTFWFLIKTESLTKNEIDNLLEFVAFSGFGADKSIGKGQIKITAINEEALPECPDANAFISLSNFIPGKPEDLNGYYQPLTKYGKLGGEWAAGRVPFKKPVVMLQAGAVIKDADYSETKTYGKLQTDIHRQKEIVQYGYAFPFPICLKEEDV